MNATPTQTAETTDSGFTVVTKDEFFKTLYADRRDIMPNNEHCGKQVRVVKPKMVRFG